MKKYIKFLSATFNLIIAVNASRKIDVPRVVEVTFINQKFIKDCLKGEEIFLPHPLDSSNLNKMSEIIMPEIWWKK